MSIARIAPTQYITASNGVEFAYRLLQPSSSTHGDGASPVTPPLVMHIHFRANMDFWDPLLLDTLLAQNRTLLIFDQSGIGRSNGTVPLTYQGWADNVIALCSALQMAYIDLLGFSMGGYCSLMVALTKPSLVRKLVICGSGPSVPMGQDDGIVWPREEPRLPVVVAALNKAGPTEDVEVALAQSFFPPTPRGRVACKAYLSRMRSRTAQTTLDGSEPIHNFGDHAMRLAQLKAHSDWIKPNPANSYPRLHELQMPVLVLNGDDDLLIPTSRSWELLKRIENCQLIIYPRSGHGFIWQYAERVARDVGDFLDRDLGSDDAEGFESPRL